MFTAIIFNGAPAGTNKIDILLSRVSLICPVAPQWGHHEETGEVWYEFHEEQPPDELAEPQALPLWDTRSCVRYRLPRIMIPMAGG